MTQQPEPEDTCRPVNIDGETIRVRGQGELTPEGEQALAALVRAAKAKLVAEAPEQVGVLQNRLRLAHQARRGKEHQLDDVRRALCDIGFMDDDDPYSHADLADVIRQNGVALREAGEADGADAVDLAAPTPATDDETVSRALFDENARRHKGAIARVDELLAALERVRTARDRMARGRNVDAIWCLDVLDAALAEPAPAATQATDDGDCCGAEPPTADWVGDCWCTLPPGHEGEHRCQTCTDRHGAPSWTDPARPA